MIKDWNNVLKIKSKYTEKEKDLMNCILFVFLYMQLNSYCNNIYGVETSDYKKMVKELSNNQKLEKAYQSINFEEKFIKPFKNIKLNNISREKVINMKEINNRNKDKKYFSPDNNSLENFLGVIYQIRCNMFHGSKSPYEDNDVKLISWAYESLYLLIQEAKLFET